MSIYTHIKINIKFILQFLIIKMYQKYFLNEM